MIVVLAHMRKRGKTMDKINDKRMKFVETTIEPHERKKLVKERKTTMNQWKHEKIEEVKTHKVSLDNHIIMQTQFGVIMVGHTNLRYL
jgi:hypothetical protein